MGTKTRTTGKVDELREVLRGKRSLLILMQDNPDPDSIAAAAALRRIANSSEVQCSIAYGGVIGRAENQALAGYLGLNFRRWGQIDPSRYEAVALVDTQPLTGNNRLPPEITPDIVLDHHPWREETASAKFSDVRPKYGAVSTILFEYLDHAGITPEPPLATALLYAIRTDTQDLGHAAVQADVDAAEALFPLANTRMLSTIQRGRVERSYFRALATALDTARVYGDRILARLGDVTPPDLTGEVADMLLRLDGSQWVMCYGFHGGQAWLSLRTAQSDPKAGEVIRKIVRGLGTGGGHVMSAGGQIPLQGKQPLSKRKIGRAVRDRFLRNTGGLGRGQRLVPPASRRQPPG